MSNTGMIIPERSRDIGDFLVGRLLPFRKKRMVGPFIFVDHMGPTRMGPNKYFDVDQHPHMGLATLTFLLEGSLVHRDSMGTEQLIKPGSVNWMVAGKGVTHTERTPEDVRNGQISTMHGYQIWVALPREHEDDAPSFHHVAAPDLPSWEMGTAQCRLIAGSAFGRQSPVPVHSPLFMMEIHAEKAQGLDLSGQLPGEMGICIVEGSVQACGERLEKGNLLVAKDSEQCPIQIGKDSHLLIFGGEPLPEKRHIAWNFVSSSREKIDQAIEDWRNKRFPQVPGDDTYVPID